MSAKPFASSGDVAEKQQILEVLADGVYALPAEGDPHVGAVEGEEFLVCFEALATPPHPRWSPSAARRTGRRSSRGCPGWPSRPTPYPA